MNKFLNFDVFYMFRIRAFIFRETAGHTVTVRYCTVRYGAGRTVWYSTVRHGTVQYGTVWYGRLWYCTVPYIVVYIKNYCYVKHIDKYNTIYRTCIQNHLSEGEIWN